MFDRLKEWHNKHLVEIIWFFIGYFTLDLINAIITNDIKSILLDVLFIGLNYYVYSKERYE